MVPRTLLPYEVTGVIRNRVHRGKLERDDGEAILGRLLALSIELRHPPELHLQAWEEAHPSVLTLRATVPWKRGHGLGAQSPFPGHTKWVA